MTKDWADKAAEKILANSYFVYEDEVRRIANIIRQQSASAWRKKNAEVIQFLSGLRTGGRRVAQS